MRPVRLLAALVLAFAGALVAMPASAATVTPTPGMVITEDTTFTPGTYTFPAGNGITIAASGITVDGNGAVLVGPGTPGDASTFVGTGIAAEGRSGVTLRGVTVRGFALALEVGRGARWTITANTFSDNYTDPDYGWGDGDLVGGVLLDHVSDSVIDGNTATGNWNGLALHYSSDNTVTGNDFSHCSNVCLKMWRASRNVITDNDFSYGIRVAPGETHARDSTSALIETGSNDNTISRNDFTHGGDGVFIRPLNGVVSTGNLFEDNDASYAHNNAWEAWSPGNTFVGNKGNHSSYGFWLGGSDHTVLRDNEAAFNGRDRANAPEPFGNAGIAIVNGSASHLVLDGNHIHDNTSVGLAIGYKEGYEAQHIVIRRNTITDNATWGVYLKHSRWIDVVGNTITGNGSGAVHEDVNTAGVLVRPGPVDAPPPEAALAVTPHPVHPGDEVTFDATGSQDRSGGGLAYRLDLGDGDVADTPVTTHRYLDPGYYRVGLTVDDGELTDLAWHDLYVTADGDEIGTDDAAGWAADHGTATGDTDHVLEGRRSILLDSTAGTDALRLGADVDLSSQDHLEAWVSFEHETRDGFTGSLPVVKVSQDGANYVEYTPSTTALDPWAVPYNEARNGWQRLSIPLQGGDGWSRSVVGSPDLGETTAVTFTVTSRGGPYRVWIDALKAVTTPPSPDLAPDLLLNTSRSGHPRPLRSFSFPGDWGLPAYDNDWAPLNGDPGDGRMWSSFNSTHAQDWYGVEFASAREINELTAWFVTREGRLAPPTAWAVEYRDGAGWKAVDGLNLDPGSARAGANTATFDPVVTSAVRVVVDNPRPTRGTGLWVGISALTARDTADLAANRLGKEAPFGTPVPAVDGATGDVWSLVDGSIRPGNGVQAAGSGPIVATVDLMRPHALDRVAVYADPGAAVTVRAWTSGAWVDVGHPTTGVSAGRTTVSFDTVHTRRLRVEVEGSSQVREVELAMSNLVSSRSVLALDVTPQASYTSPYDTLTGPLDDSTAASPRWTAWNSQHEQDWYAVVFDRPTTASRVDLWFYDDGGGVIPPAEYRLEYRDGTTWKPVEVAGRTPSRPSPGWNSVTFDAVTTSGIRMVGTNANPVQFGQYVGLTEFELYR